MVTLREIRYRKQFQNADKSIRLRINNITDSTHVVLFTVEDGVLLFICFPRIEKRNKIEQKKHRTLNSPVTILKEIILSLYIQKLY